MQFPTIPGSGAVIFNKLLANGHQAFLVGGAVRDILLGNRPQDFDIATDATPDRIKEIFSGHLPVNLVGASFGVCLVDGIEVATFRTDSHNGGNHKDTTVSFVGDIWEDLARRDFTINAIAMDSDGNLVDPYNGIRDLQTRVLRFVGNPLARIGEDTNRVLRALRFCAILGFKLSGVTERAIRMTSCRVAGIAPERVRLELLKTLSGTKKASVFFELARNTNVLQFLFPELEDGLGHSGGDYHGETVWEHNMLAGDAISCKYPLVKLAGYLHDVGKPSSYNGSGESSTFHDHECEGGLITSNRLQKLTFTNAEQETVTNLVQLHMRPLRNLSSKARRKLLVTLFQRGVHWKDLVRVRLADRRGNLAKTPHTFADIREYVATFTEAEEVIAEPTQLAISGGKIMELLGVQPGPIIGHVQKELLQYVMEHGEEYNTYDTLLDVLSTLVSSVPLSKHTK